MFKNLCSVLNLLQIIYAKSSISIEGRNLIHLLNDQRHENLNSNN